MVGEHDRQESNADEQVSIRSLQDSRRRFQARPDPAIKVAKGSVLDAEKAHTARSPSSSQVLAQRARAVENLERLFQIVIDDANGEVRGYLFSPYPLIRASVEAAATALWLIQSSKKQDRVIRSLQIEYRNTMERVRFVELLTTRRELTEEKRAAEAVIRRLAELKNSVAPLRQIALGYPPKYTEILRSVSTKNRSGPSGGYDLLSPLVVWKLASAFVHGSEDVIRALSDMRQTSEFEDGTAIFYMTPSFRVLAGSVLACVTLIQRVDDRYSYLSAHDHAGRPVAA